VEVRADSSPAFGEKTSGGSRFKAVNPATGEALPGEFVTATAEQIEHAANLAASATLPLSRLAGAERGKMLRNIAAALESNGDEIVTRAHQETALTLDRLRGELGRTTSQLRLFAALCEEGSWVNARIDTAQPDRKPLPKPDVRSMLRPLGPVVVFGASNFPLAFSVAGGDTASALAAGNPVLIKVHPAHPGTSEIVGRAVTAALHQSGAPQGTFSLLFDGAVEVGRALVKHPLVKAAGFTGSRKAGRALMDLAASRPEPIPVFAEMSSSNPLFILAGALRERGDQIAAGLVASFTLGVGQFCTKPGIVFVASGSAADDLIAKIVELTGSAKEGVLLTSGIARSYQSGVKNRAETVRLLAGGGQKHGCGADVAVFETDFAAFRANPELADELFGPSVLIVRCKGVDDMLEFAHTMPGQLTATLHGTDADLCASSSLMDALQARAGRLIVNGYPTGVEVCHAMVHGGVYPATSDSRFTSVGTLAIYRFARPVCFQNCPNANLPDELKDANPLGILRSVNGQMTREKIMR
jgi:alpha-ketoglutaric semialdehyde dehydrogenase